MARLTEEMVIARSRQSDLSAIKKLNCWGGELMDVSILRRMPNVEVLALSINKIRSLEDFASCRRLRELYIRKNEIRDLREIRHLRNLPLESLWLDENPCTQHQDYRMTVLRNLPNLEKLDNEPVHPEEVSEAMRRGVHIPDSDEESAEPNMPSNMPMPNLPPTTVPHYQPQRSSDSSPEREEYARQYRQGSEESPAESSNERTEQAQCPASSEPEERHIHSAMTRSHYESGSTRSPEQPLRHSHSAHSVKQEYYPTNGECRQQARLSPPPQYEQYYERSDRETQPTRSEAWERDSARSQPVRERDRERDYPSAVMADHRGFTRRPVTRSSNLLSAVLCLVKELDYTSLEVAEMAVRCRMDELANAE